MMRLAYGFGPVGPPQIGTMISCGDGLHIIKDYAGGKRRCVCRGMYFSTRRTQGGPFDVLLPTLPEGDNVPVALDTEVIE